MFNKLLLLIFAPILLFFMACSEAPPETDTDSSFYVAPPDLLYFRNIRQTAYSNPESPKEGLDLYIQNRWVEDEAYLGIKPTLVINWMEDQAYIMLQWQGVESNPDSIWWKTDTATGSFAWEDGNLEKQWAYARQIRDLLQQNAQIRLSPNADTDRIAFEDSGLREAFLITMRDYLKLVGGN
ncbi:MAG: hypothetical protein GYB31_10615 [Bacteroidetes bacterium]|nr:hypothetical protein [Bacteroidota bacterium]